MRTDGKDALAALVRGKSVLFITTKNLDYIRNTQEISLLRAAARRVDVVGSADKSYVKRLLKVYFRLLTLRMKPYDAVFVGFAPQLILPFWGWKLNKKPVAEDFFISLYDTLAFDRRTFAPESLPAHILLRLDRASLRRAGLIVCDTAAHGEYFASLGAEPARLHVLYLEADRTVYEPRPQEKPPEWKNKFVVLYFGSVLPLQGVDVLLRCVRQLAIRRDIVFDIVGPVGREAAEAAREGGNVQFTPWLSQPALARRIADADLCLAGHFSAGIAKAARTIPGKAYIYEAMERPMVLGDNPANRELFTEDASHRFARMGDPEDLGRQILAAARQAGFCLNDAE